MPSSLAGVFRALILSVALGVAACTPLVTQQAGQPPTGFTGASLQPDAVVSFDGARLGLSRWDAPGEPRAVIVAVHGMNDYGNAFNLAAPAWAQAGATTYAYDQRGFGRSPGRGVWAGEDLMVEDLRTVAALVRARHPGVPLAIVGESMGGAVAVQAFASDRPPTADRLVLLSPAVWGWKAQPLPNKTLLWFAANFTGDRIYTPPRWLTSKVKATDNREELMAMGRDPLMVWGARSDTLYGLVELMDRAAVSVAKAPPRTLYLYGANDQIIPARAQLRAAARAPGHVRTAYYQAGWHLLTRDLQRDRVIADVAAFIANPDGTLPSGAPPIPTRPQAARRAGQRAGL